MGTNKRYADAIDRRANAKYILQQSRTAPKRQIYPTGPVDEIEADDMDALLAKVPEGQILLSVRAL